MFQIDRLQMQIFSGLPSPCSTVPHLVADPGGDGIRHLGLQGPLTDLSRPPETGACLCSNPDDLFRCFRDDEIVQAFLEKKKSISTLRGRLILVSPIFLAPSDLRCANKNFGNLHQGCGCFDVIYPGNRYDCGQPDCGVSASHAHRAYCRCPKAPIESRRIINLFRPMCDRHKAAQWEAAVGRRSNGR